MKISWLSNAPWAATGYGNQTKLITKRLRSILGHDTQISAFYGLNGGILNWEGSHVYPGGYHPYGMDVASAHASHYGAKILITLLDSWVCEPSALQTPTVNWIPYFPVDSFPLPPCIRDRVRMAYKRIVFSKFGEQMVHDAGLDCYYVPHCVDTDVFKKTSRKEAREKLGIKDDKFIVGMVAANKGTPSRKAFTQQIEAYANFAKGKDNVLLYLHTAKAEHGENAGVNLVEFIKYLGIQEKVAFCDQYTNVVGYPDEYMVNVYNAMDVLLSVTMGEGFGIPIIEAQACGTPVIVGEWTAMTELCYNGSLISEIDADKWWNPLATYQMVPRIGAIQNALQRAYVGNYDHTDIQGVRLNYGADDVIKRYWKPTLENVEKCMAEDDQKMQLVKF
jgi:glycosyltransferase involved in cell wall biosynthesis